MIPPVTLSCLTADAADRRPAEPAVHLLDRVVTWAEVDAAAGRLAAALVAVGVTRGDRVGVLHRKSLDGFVAAHAVVRLGAVSVPLDPTASVDYLRSVATLAGCRALLSHEPCRAAATELAGLPGIGAVIGLDAPAAAAPAPSVSFLGPGAIAALDPRSPQRCRPDEVAYLITTSGSTGRPKAISHTHGSAAAHIAFMTRAIELRPDDRISDIAPSHFDISTVALWVTPAVGASNVVVPEPHQMLPASMSQLAADQAVSVWYSVPYLLVQLLNRGQLAERDLSALRLVLFGGEVFPPRVLAGLMERLPAAHFVNVYGPAEVNACTIHHLPPAAEVAAADDVPIGRPVQLDAAGGTEVRVVDPDGSTGRGELWVRSATMMQGYWQRPDLDSEVFVDDGDGRWYRTGDLGWRRPDGELVFAGRLDHQVKVRGHRVELEAVESVLEEQPGVAAAVAAVARTPGGDDTLIAGLIAAPGRSYDPDELLRSARERLPAYALPTYFLAVDELVGALPTTGSGKLDRRSLRDRIVEAHQLDRHLSAGSTQPKTDRTPVPVATPAPAGATTQEGTPS